MADYVIGDIQGCFESLLTLLDYINFDKFTDRLWFVGDLVNRGPRSLETLRFIKNLPVTPRITLGNHDLHLLSKIFINNRLDNHDDTLSEILNAPDCEELGHWLRMQSILYHDPLLNIVMCHAGIAPIWDLGQAKALAFELEEKLRHEDFRDFLTHMYGNQPDHWSDDLTGMPRLRVICNFFTRMRFCDAHGNLVLNFKGTIEQAPSNLYPWYMLANRKEIDADIVFGHWAALKGICPHPRIHAVDTGCFWGGQLTALRLQDKQRFVVPCKI